MCSGIVSRPFCIMLCDHISVSWVLPYSGPGILFLIQYSVAMRSRFIDIQLLQTAHLRCFSIPVCHHLTLHVMLSCSFPEYQILHQPASCLQSTTSGVLVHFNLSPFVSAFTAITLCSSGKRKKKMSSTQSILFYFLVLL